ncbi:hypothetical protein SAMN05421753_104124 [Planctomicrobium piriforme]|uniref:Uncharacterized protein n=1 Tax=Planctomicrobium piriforme TaxID=1576369 RepID=A0A1I3E8W1_9PLAN|nr:hypothetical protein SAMN05421753_104124 [Planctomicrobium piriforme]
MDLLNQQDSFVIAHLVLCREFEMENVGQRSNPDGYDVFHNGLLVQIRRQIGPTQPNQIFTATYPDAEEQRKYLQQAWIKYLTLQPD